MLLFRTSVKCCFSFLILDASSVMSTVSSSRESPEATIEVGQGSLKLMYAAEEGKLTQYVNTRNQVLCFNFK